MFRSKKTEKIYPNDGIYTEHATTPAFRAKLRHAEERLKSNTMLRVPEAKKPKDTRSSLMQEFHNQSRNKYVHYDVHLKHPIRESRKKTGNSHRPKGGKSRRRKHRKTVKKGYFW